MDTNPSNGDGWPEAIGRFIGIAMVAIVTMLLSSLALSIAWSRGPARLLSLPDATWADSLACLVSVWVLSAPFRLLRVKMVD